MTVISILEEKVGTEIQVCICTVDEHQRLVPWEGGKALCGFNILGVPPTTVKITGAKQKYLNSFGIMHEWYEFEFTHQGVPMSVRLGQ